MAEKEMQEFAMRITKPGIPHSDEEIEKVLRRVLEEDAATIWVLIRAYRKVGHNLTEGEFRQFLVAQCAAGGGRDDCRSERGDEISRKQESHQPCRLPINR